MYQVAKGAFAVMLALLGPRAADMPNELQLKPGDTIVAIGDSITEQGGYLRNVDAVLAQQYPDLKISKIVNKGIGGQKAEDLVKRFDRDVVRRRPSYATISIGINDVWHRLGKPHDPRRLGGLSRKCGQNGRSGSRGRHQGHLADAHADRGEGRFRRQ